MNITSFNPQILSKNAEPIVKLFEEMGFERKHMKDDFTETNVLGYQLTNADGFVVDISQTDNAMLPVDSMASIRMNVDNYDEVYEYLVSLGFRSVYGDRPANAATSKSNVMIAPSGFSINLVEHLKNR
jgi:hypothetical protein